MCVFIFPLFFRVGGGGGCCWQTGSRLVNEASRSLNLFLSPLSPFPLQSKKQNKKTHVELEFTIHCAHTHTYKNYQQSQVLNINLQTIKNPHSQAPCLSNSSVSKVQHPSTFSLHIPGKTLESQERDKSGRKIRKQRKGRGNKIQWLFSFEEVSATKARKTRGWESFKTIQPDLRMDPWLLLLLGQGLNSVWEVR